MNESDKRKFIQYLAGEDKPALVNEHSLPLESLVHPLTYSIDLKNHPDMVAVCMNYKQTKEFFELYRTLKTIPK